MGQSPPIAQGNLEAKNNTVGGKAKGKKGLEKFKFSIN